jgi:predicted nucleic acid-binding protein
VAASDPKRIVLDTNVCLDLFVFADPACAALAAALDHGRLEAVTDTDCRAEWVRVLDYPALRLDAHRKARALAAFDAAQRSLLPGAPPPGIVLPRCRDPDDQKFLELAARCGTIALVSRDASLLQLSRRTLRVAGFVVVPPVQVATLLENPAGAARGAQ